MGARVLVIDNYDSFVYNLVQYLGELGAEPLVHRNDAAHPRRDRSSSTPTRVLISPGPGHARRRRGCPTTSSAHFAGRVARCSACASATSASARCSAARSCGRPQVMHGKTSLIRHDGVGVFAGLPQPLEATRYHSLVVDRASVPDVLEITAETDDGLVMGLRHRELDVEGVQFHPESILTVGGHDLLGTLLDPVEAVTAGLRPPDSP